MRIDKDTKFFIVVRDEKGKERRIPLTGNNMSLNMDMHEGAWVEDAEIPVLQFEVQTPDETIPFLTGARVARMDIR